MLRYEKTKGLRKGLNYCFVNKKRTGKKEKDSYHESVRRSCKGRHFPIDRVSISTDTIMTLRFGIKRSGQ